MTTFLFKNGFTTTTNYFFLIQIKGLDPAEALLLIGVTSIAKSLAEVPTGVIADKFSRKRSMALGLTIMVIAWSCTLIVQEFPLLFLTMVLRGIGSSFVSGADESLLYDTMRELGETGKYKSRLNIAKSFHFIQAAITSLLGGILGSIDLHLPIIASLLCISIASVLANFLIEPSKSDKGESIEHLGYLTHTTRSLKAIFSKKGLLSGLLFMTLIISLMQAMLKANKDIIAPILSGFHVEIELIGAAAFVIYLVKAFGAFIASKFNKVGNEFKEIFVGISIYFLGFVGLAVIDNVVGAVFILAITISLDPLILSNYMKLLNEIIPSSKRSTILSLLSLISEGIEMIYLSLFGWLLGQYSIDAPIILVIVLLILVFSITKLNQRFFMKI